MEKTHCWPEGHWNWPITVTHKHGVRCGDMIWVGGQVSLTAAGDVLNPHDLEQQVVRSMQNVDAVLRALNCDLEDLVSLLCYYVNDGSVDEVAFLRMIADALPEGTKTTVNAVPVPSLAYDGLMVEVEGCAMRQPNGARTLRTYAISTTASLLPSKFCPAIRSGKMIFVSGQYPFSSDGEAFEPHNIPVQFSKELNLIKDLLAQFDASLDDVVKLNSWFTPELLEGNTDLAVCSHTEYFDALGPATTNILLPRHANNDVLVKASGIAMLGEGGEHLPRRYASPEIEPDEASMFLTGRDLKCENMIFLSSQISQANPSSEVEINDIATQTHQTMRRIGAILNDLGASFDDVCKVTAFYRAGCGADALHSNLPIRSSYFTEPGPSTTGIPLPEMINPGSLIAVEMFAMATLDK